MNKEIYDEIRKAIKDRSSWETKQDKCYRLRFTGIRRPRRPYPNAPDVHYPLIDTTIEKLKPFYVQQIYSQDRLATFVSESNNSRERTIMAEQWFDYQVKQRSNFERQLIIAVDTHLTYSMCPIKIYWDTDKRQLSFDAVDPLYIIVPTWTEDLQDADWLVHVLRMSKAQYKSNPRYNPALADEISGKGDSNLSMSLAKEQDAASREGITYAPDDTQIVLWECYTKQENGKWLVETIAPTRGYETKVREPFNLPYQHGQLPFVAIRADLSQKGWYSPRGVPEILQEFEQMLNKMENSLLQFLDFSGHPMFKNTGMTPINAQNFSPGPGRVLPPGLDPVIPTSAPVEYQEQMQYIRALSEDRVQIPDFGTSESLAGQNQKGGKTATAVNAIVGLTNQSNDLRARQFRLQLSEIYRQAWSLLVENAGDQLQFISDNQAQELPPDVLKDTYTITPSGSADSWDVGKRQAEALALYQLLFGKPNANQDELLKYLLESGKQPNLVKRLFQDTGQASQLQGERQAGEINDMLIGFPVSTKQDDDDDAHINTIDGFLQRRLATGEAITPELGQLMLQHRQGHVNQARSKRNPNAQAYQKMQNQMQKMFQQAMAVASAPPPTSPEVMAIAEQQAGAQQQQQQLPPSA